MFIELMSFKIFCADLTEDHHIWANSFNMFFVCGSSQILKFWQLAYLTMIFCTFIILRMFLKLSNTHPFHFSFRRLKTFMWEFTKINTVSNNWINFNQKLTLCIAVRTTDVFLHTRIPLYTLLDISSIQSQISHCLSSHSSLISFKMLSFFFQNSNH